IDIASNGGKPVPLDAQIYGLFGATRIVFSIYTAPEGARRHRLTTEPMWAQWPTHLPQDLASAAYEWVEIQDGVGWPARSLTCFWRFVSANPTYQFSVEGGFPLQDDPGSIGECERAIPYIVIWPGFAINTVFYAAVLWGMWLVPGFVR